MKYKLYSYPFLKMDLKAWIGKNSINSFEKIKRKVYLIHNVSMKYYLKKIDSIHEYQIIEQLSKLCLSTFQNSILLTSGISIKKLFANNSDIPNQKEYNYIVTEEIIGENLYQCLDKLSHEQLKNILDTIIFSLRVAWENFGFVHLDLHLGNIMIQKINNPILLETEWKKNSFHPIINVPSKILVQEYLPIIIDFDMSITTKYPGISNKNTNLLQDIWHLLGILSLYLNQEKGKLVLDYIENFIDRYEFQEQKEKFANEWFNILPISNI
jgi:hypothetical protein